MAQDENKGTAPGPGGKARDPAPTDTSTRDIHADPLPEKPATPPTDAAPAAAAGAEAGGAEEGSPAAGAAETVSDAGAGGGPGGKTPPVDQTKALENAVEAAKRTLKEQEEKLARHKEEVAAEKAAADLVKAYEAEAEALRLAEKDLEQYRAAETDYVTRYLDPETIPKIKDAAKTAQAAKDALVAKVSADVADVADKRRTRDDAKEEAAKAREKADALKRPAGPIRDRLNAAGAIRSEAKKASDDGKYALAYWLVMPDGKLDKAIKAEPRILDHDVLSDKLNAARKAQEDAEKALAVSEQALKGAEDKLREDQARLVDLEKGFDATVLENVAALNPTIVKAA